MYRVSNPLNSPGEIWFDIATTLEGLLWDIDRHNNHLVEEFGSKRQLSQITGNVGIIIACYLQYIYIYEMHQPTIIVLCLVFASNPVLSVLYIWHDNHNCMHISADPSFLNAYIYIMVNMRFVFSQFIILWFQFYMLHHTICVSAGSIKFTLK